MVPPHLDLKLLLNMSVDLGLDDLATEIQKVAMPSPRDWINASADDTELEDQVSRAALIKVRKKFTWTRCFIWSLIISVILVLLIRFINFLVDQI